MCVVLLLIILRCACVHTGAVKSRVASVIMSVSSRGGHLQSAVEHCEHCRGRLCLAVALVFGRQVCYANHFKLQFVC